MCLKQSYDTKTKKKDKKRSQSPAKSLGPIGIKEEHSMKEFKTQKSDPGQIQGRMTSI